MTATTNDLTMPVPLDFNGYVAVAAPAQRMPASEVQVGDVLLLDGYVTTVTAIDMFDLAWHGAEHPIGTSLPQDDYRWPVLKFSGVLNIVRFPQELVSVIRRG